MFFRKFYGFVKTLSSPYLSIEQGHSKNEMKVLKKKIQRKPMNAPCLQSKDEN
jgi:hypothetical protein